MRKIFLLVLVATLLIVNFSFAQGSRQPTSSEGKTTFTNLAVVGLNKDGSTNPANQGLPGYIEMTTSAGTVFYLFVDQSGRLKIASDIAVGYLASPAIVGWRDASGSVVGAQTN